MGFYCKWDVTVFFMGYDGLQYWVPMMGANGWGKLENPGELVHVGEFDGRNQRIERKIT